MESERDFAAYRERILNDMREGIHRSTCESADPIQVFMNQRRVGLLDRNGGESTLHVRSQARIESIQLRSEDGVLLGGLSAPEYGFRSSRISLMHTTVELDVHNTAQGGSVRAVCIPEPGFRYHSERERVGAVDRAAQHPVAFTGVGMRAIAFTQVLLAVMLVGLVVDRTTGWMTPVHSSLPVTQADAPWAAPFGEVAKLEEQLTELSRMQTKAVETIQTHQQGMAQLQQTMAKLSSTQEAVVSNVLNVKQRRKAAGRDDERITRMIMNITQREQEQLEAEIHSLTVANDRLSQEMADLEQDNQNLKKRLQSEGVGVSKSTALDREKLALAQKNEADQTRYAPPVAKTRAVSQQPLSEGTSLESIE
ncbi:MAG TPA: hypothetical protein VLA67_10515 [Nitrospiraceae bacterium]|nr:hypothetical protein [Nitrospiraceae bacterium]